MDFNDTTGEATFRAEARAFLDEHAPAHLPPAGAEDHATFLARARRWQALKQQHGWACLNWPKEHGGRGASPMELIIWGQEEGRWELPVQPFAIGLGMCGPTVAAFANDEHKAQHLPRMASGEHIWCQLFSEPAGGSDLANLRTRAERDGDDWVINGQKIWTSGAHYSDYGILVTRTDPDVPKHKGLTMFFIDMHDPAVEVRPIRQISGASNFNEVYFTDLRIPDHQRLGEVGDGWKVSLVTLMNERLAVGGAGAPDFQHIWALAEQVDLDGQPALRNAAVRARLADWYCEMSGLKYTRYRVQSALSRGETPGPENSITKVVSANKQQAIASFGMDLMDMGGVLTGSDVPGGGAFMQGFMGAPGLRIAGGTDEILRNIIAERVLGLPQDVRVDKGVPFSAVPQGGGRR